jgi:hypothetical protein
VTEQGRVDAMTNADAAGLVFFNELCGHLAITLSEPPLPVAGTVRNVKASPTATIRDITLTLEIFEDEEADKPRALTDEEWSRVVLRTPSIRMRGQDAKKVVEHVAPNGGSFTVRDLARAVLETERQSRASTDWLGGIDVHHVFFQGMSLDDEGVWCISWGS